MASTAPYYTYKETITYTCKQGYGLSTDYNSTVCVPAMNETSVIGKWNRPPPNCEVTKIQQFSF